MMRKFTLLLLGLFVISFASTEIDFDIDKASKEANRTQKTVMIFFHKDYCGYCSKMEENLESEKITKAIKKDFIFLSINRDDDETVSYQDFEGGNHQFAKALDINFYPSLMFIEGNNSIVYDVVGYRDEHQIAEILQYIDRKAYQNMTLEEFKDELLFEE